MTFSTNQKPTIYRDLYDNTGETEIKIILSPIRWSLFSRGCFHLRFHLICTYCTCAVRLVVELPAVQPPGSSPGNHGADKGPLSTDVIVYTVNVFTLKKLFFANSIKLIVSRFYCREIYPINPLTAKLFNLNFHSLEVVSRWRDPQLQVSENYSDLAK